MRLFFVPVLVILITAGAAAQSLSPAAPSLSAPTGPNQIKSPEVLSNNQVTFRLNASLATKVTVGGDFPSGFTAVNLPLTKGADGIWSVTVGPLQQGLYTYYFNVDGMRAPDPANPHRNWFIISGPLADLYADQDVPHGSVSEMWYPSPLMKMSLRRARVYLPPGYEGGSTHYPVLYLLHGGNQDEESWITDGRAAQTLDNLIASGKAKPMIVVMPNGMITQTAARSYVTTQEPRPGSSNIPFVDSLVSELIPFVDKTYRTLPDRYSRAIAGLSMGGGQTMYAAFTHPELFGWVETMSGAQNVPGAVIVIPPPPNAADLHDPGLTQSVDVDKFFAGLPQLNPAVASQFRLFELTVGSHDGFLTEHRAIVGAMKARGIGVVAVEVPVYMHEWPFWRFALADMLPKLFQTRN